MKKIIAILGLVLMASTVFADSLDCRSKFHEKNNELSAELKFNEGLVSNPFLSSSDRLALHTQIMNTKMKKYGIMEALLSGTTTSKPELNISCDQ